MAGLYSELVEAAKHHLGRGAVGFLVGGANL